MKKLLYILLFLFFVFDISAKDKASKQTVVFNVMLTKENKDVTKKISEKPGVVSARYDATTSTVEVAYKPTETNIKNISDAFKENGVLAFPIGENCSAKKGGCLNNSATQINTMK